MSSVVDEYISQAPYLDGATISPRDILLHQGSPVSHPSSDSSARRLSSPTPPQLQKRSPRFRGGLPHRTYGPAPETTRRVAAFRPIYDHRRHVAAPFRRRWRHRHSCVPPLQRTTTFVAHCGSPGARGGGIP